MTPREALKEAWRMGLFENANEYGSCLAKRLPGDRLVYVHWEPALRKSRHDNTNHVYSVQTRDERNNLLKGPEIIDLSKVYHWMAV